MYFNLIQFFSVGNYCLFVQFGHFYCFGDIEIGKLVSLRTLLFIFRVYEFHCIQDIHCNWCVHFVAVFKSLMLEQFAIYSKQNLHHFIMTRIKRNLIKTIWLVKIDWEQ